MSMRKKSVLEFDVIEIPAAALALDSMKTRLLQELAEPASAASLASRLGLTRQRVKYHSRRWKTASWSSQRRNANGAVERRRWSQLASSYVISPAALGPMRSIGTRQRPPVGQ
ncbi:Exonuclease SbcC [Mesorhizobium escarrei]|uniref:Exonuclease SbcC n=1 Tax=Mesorhizobium escarrei TaxID=666018 RepID=A0ABM9E4I7_9HYPH|nr:Exonuclease SbcC [Mesorhizobium escarrei]